MAAGIAGNYLTRELIESRLTPLTVRQIFDDGDQGEASKASLDLYAQQSESYVEGFLRNEYTLSVLRAMGPDGTNDVPIELVRLCLDVFESYAIRRHPEYIRGDWQTKLKQARSELMDLVKGHTRLDVDGSPEPAANQVTTVRSGDPNDPTPKAKFFVDGLGDF